MTTQPGEMISLQGNVVTDVNGRLKEHAHGMFSYLLPDSGEIAYLGGHLHSAWISYTGEIVLDVVEDGFIGQQFEGSISSVTGWGMYVELENTVEGLVHVSTLYDDHYDFIEENLTLVGERTGRTFKLGQPVTVILDSVDENARTIDFVLEEFQRF